MPSSTTLIWMFVLVTLVPGMALLLGDRIAVNRRSGLLLALSGALLAMACLTATAALAYDLPALLS